MPNINIFLIINEHSLENVPTEPYDLSPIPNPLEEPRIMKALYGAALLAVVGLTACSDSPTDPKAMTPGAVSAQCNNNSNNSNNPPQTAGSCENNNNNNNNNNNTGNNSNNPPTTANNG